MYGKYKDIDKKYNKFLPCESLKMKTNTWDGAYFFLFN